MNFEKIEQIETLVNSKYLTQNNREFVHKIIQEVVVDCSRIIRKNPMYTSFYQNPDTMADQLLNAYGVSDE